MVFLLGALCYTICTMKAPPQALPGPEEEPSWHVPFHGIYRSLLSRPFQGLERRLHGIPVWCSVLYNMHYEGSSSGPGRAWGGAFMAFKLAKVLGNSHATHGSGLALTNFM